jgi:hypothetical protein
MTSAEDQQPPAGSQEPHQKDLTTTDTAGETVHDGNHERGDMGGNIGPTQPSTRGGSGRGPDEVRELEERDGR